MRLRQILLFIVCAALLGALLFPVSAVWADSLPERASISGVVGYPQRFTLSCEARSAVDWAAYWGISLREKKFLRSLPRSDNPDEGFVGDPNGAWGGIPPYSYGVHAGPVAATLRSFGLQAEAHKDLSWNELRAEIAAGRPVIVWVIGQMWTGSPVLYKSSDGASTTVARFEHTMILTGYTPASVQVVDAYSGQNQTYSLNVFLASWKVLGRMAVTGQAPPTPKPTPASVPTAMPTIPPELNQRTFLPVMFGPDTMITLSQDESGLPATYTVQRGDFLVALGRKFHMDWKKLADENSIGYPYVIHPGQVLEIP